MFSHSRESVFLDFTWEFAFFYSPELAVLQHMLGDGSVQQESSPLLLAQQGTTDRLTADSFCCLEIPDTFEFIGWGARGLEGSCGV